jgi:hypothetical protein
MSREQVDFFVSQYSSMSDDELAYLIAAKREGLSQDAARALDIVLKQRDPEALVTALSETATEIAAQAETARKDAEEARKLERAIRRVVHAISSISIAIGLLAVAFERPEEGYLLSGMGAALLVAYHFHRLHSRLVSALFRPD